MRNIGNKDYENFNFGINLPEDIKTFQVNYNSTNRFRIAKFTENISFENKTHNIDFTLTPFNRKDIYKFTLICTSDKEADSNFKIEFGSTEPVKFIDNLNTNTQLAQSIILKAAVSELGFYIKR